MTRPKTRPTLLSALLPLLAAGALALCAAPGLGHDQAHHQAAPTGQGAEIGAETLALPDLPVTDAAGFTAGFRSRLRAAAPVVIVTFGYTSCTTLCDYGNGILLWVQDLLAAAGRTDVALVTVTIDPARDTPAALDARARELGAGEEWLWLTAGTAPLLQALRVPDGPIESHDLLFLVGHPCTGAFVRVVGLADPQALIDAAGSAAPECAA